MLQIKDKKFNLAKYREYLTAIEEPEYAKYLIKTYEYCVERSKFLLISVLQFSTVLYV